MNAVTAALKASDVAHEHRGDLFREDEDPSETAGRMRAHLRRVFPGMVLKARQLRTAGGIHLRISITRYGIVDLSDRDAGFAAMGLVDAELERFVRFDWDPHRGVRHQSLSYDTSIDPALHAAASGDFPDLKPLISFAHFIRTARPGDQLEYVAGRETHQGERVVITAISARRLTTRPADPTTDGGESRVPIQGGACFVSDGDLICFKHSGFAHQGGYSLMRWIRQP